MDTETPMRERAFTRRQYLTYQTLMDGQADVGLAMEAVSSWAIENPDVDMDETMTWAEWGARGKSAGKSKKKLAAR